MVQGIDLVQVNVVFLSFNSKRSIHDPSVHLDNTCKTGFYELKKHREMKRRQKHEMGAEAYNHYKWYNMMLRTELQLAPPDSKLKIVHWYIESGNADAFKMDGVLYEAVSIIIGANMEHWYCANIGQDANNICGSRQRLKTNLPQEILTTSYNLDTYRPGAVARSNDNVKSTKCSIDFCANNCGKCKKYATPFPKPILSKCACYIEKKFSRIIEEKEDDGECVLVVVPKTALESKKDTLRRSCASPSTLDTICEERLIMLT